MIIPIRKEQPFWPIMKCNLDISEAVPQEVWSVVVVYEDVSTRESAMAVCDQLVKQFWPEIEFKFLWWRTDFLEDDGMAATAGENATQADFIIFCGGPEHPLSLRMRQWFQWSLQRNGQDLALIDLTDTGAGGHAREKATYLREIARRGRVDYLTNSAADEMSPEPELPADTLPLLAASTMFDRILSQANGPHPTMRRG